MSALSSSVSSGISSGSHLENNLSDMNNLNNVKLANFSTSMNQNFGILQNKLTPKIVINDNTTTNHSKEDTDRWILKLDNLFSSPYSCLSDSLVEHNSEIYADFIPLLDWHAQSILLAQKPFFQSDTFSFLKSKALKNNDLAFLIPNGSHLLKLENIMKNGIVLKKTEIVRLKVIKSSLLTIQTLEYGTCRLKACQQRFDKILLFMSVGTRVNTLHVYDEKGEIKGRISSKQDYSVAKKKFIDPEEIS